MMHDTECGLPCKTCNDTCCFMDIACDGNHQCWICFKKNLWYVYVLKCADETLYTGITQDLNKRIEKHNNGTGAKYTKGRGPVTLMHKFSVRGKSEALKFEYKIKKLSREEKLALTDLSKLK